MISEPRSQESLQLLLILLQPYHYINRSEFLREATAWKVKTLATVDNSAGLLSDPILDPKVVVLVVGMMVVVKVTVVTGLVVMVVVKVLAGSHGRNDGGGDGGHGGGITPLDLLSHRKKTKLCFTCIFV